MDLRSLIAKMDAIESLAEDRAEYDRYKADDARAAAVEKVKQYASIPLNQIPRLANAIDPKTGIIYYGDAGGEAGEGTAKKMPLQFMSQSDQKSMLDAIKAAGLEVIPHDEKTLFGSAQYAKVDPAKLAKIDTLASDAASNADLLAKLKLLLELIDKYNALKAKKASGAPTTAGQGANPTTTTEAVCAKCGVKRSEHGMIKHLFEPKATKESVEFNGSIARSLTESFGYTSEEQTDEGLGSLLGKAASKAAPGVGAYMGATSAIDSYKKGDYLGAALNGLSGAFSLVPGLGWIPAVGLGLWQAGREISGAADAAGRPQSPRQGQQGGKSTGGVDPKVQALQKKLLAAGADLGPTGADGVMGPKTQAAMQKFPNIKEGTEMSQPKSLAESIKELQDRLAMIEAEEAPAAQPEAEPATGEENSLAKQLEQAGGKLMEKDGRQFMVLPEKGIAVEIPSMEIVDASTPALTPTGKQFDPAALGLSEGLDEGIWDSIVKGAVKLAPKLSQGVKTGFTKGALSAGTASRAGVANRAGNVIGRTAKGVSNVGKTIAKNPLKAGALAGAAGLGLGLASGPGGAGANPTGTIGGGGGAGGGPTNVMPTAPEGDDEEMKALRAQIDALIKELSSSQDPAIQKGLADAKAKLGS